MNRIAESIRDLWQRSKNGVLARFGFLTDSELDGIAVRRAELAERLQQRPGVTLEQAEAQREAFDRARTSAPPIEQRSGR